MRHHILRCLSFSLLLLLSGCSQQSDNHAESAIRHVLLATWDKPESPLIISPVSIADQHALAGWTQGEKGGVALLEQDKDGQWFVSVCGTTEIASADILSMTGIAASQARQLSAAFLELSHAEPPQRQALFDSFGEAVTMGNHHQTHHPH